MQWRPLRRVVQAQAQRRVGPRILAAGVRNAQLRVDANLAERGLNLEVHQLNLDDLELSSLRGLLQEASVELDIGALQGRALGEEYAAALATVVRREPRAELVAIGGDGALRHRPLTTPIRRQRQKVRETLLVESRET